MLIFLIIVFYMLILPIAIVWFLYQILTKTMYIEMLVEEPKIEPKKTRKHPTIEKNDYNNVFNGKKAYDIYKNKATGLYEPQTPSKGVKIEKKEE